MENKAVEENIKYFKVNVVLGHLGKAHGLETCVYVTAPSMYQALLKAKHLPAVKHGKMPKKAVEITKEEYEQGIEEGKYYESIGQIFPYEA